MEKEEKKPATPITASEVFKEFFADEKTVTLRNGMSFLIKKTDIQGIMQSRATILPIIETQEGINKLTPEKREELRASGRNVLNHLLIAAVKSPKFIEGAISNEEANEIAVDDPRLPEAVKIELQGYVYEFNGYTGTARQFFRLLSPGELPDA